jgi:hypothetical protein
MAKVPNYISERQRYIPNLFKEDSLSDAERTDIAKCMDYDTKIGDILSRYSVMFKVDRVASIPPSQLELTRHGKKFLDAIRRKLGAIPVEYRTLVVNNFRGRRIAYDYDETFEILVFDTNGFLVGNPPLDKAVTMVIDDNLYIGFLQDRYDPIGSPDRDTSGSGKYTSSTVFDIVGIVVDKNGAMNITPQSVGSNNFDGATCTVINETTFLPKMFIPFGGHDLNASRSLRYTENNLEDLKVFATVDLNDCIERIDSDLDLPYPKFIEDWHTIKQGLTLPEQQLVVNEIKEVLRQRARYISFVPLNYTAEVGTRNNEAGVFLNPVDGSSYDYYLLKDYELFSVDRTVSVKLGLFPYGTQFKVQNRNHSFVQHLQLKYEGQNEYSLSSPGDNNAYADCIKELDLFDEHHGLFAIPLVSYDRVTEEEGGQIALRGTPYLGFKEPDIMLWIDGVKMTPYADYQIVNGPDAIFGGQYIRLTKLPGSPAASTAGDAENTIGMLDDAMFPVPAEDCKYNITIVAAWHRGNHPEAFNDHDTITNEEYGLLDRYIGPRTYGTKATPASRRDYPVPLILHSGESSARGCPVWLTRRPGYYYKHNHGFEYNFLAMVPVGAMPESSILAFQLGRYIPLSKYSRRTAGDRAFVFNSYYNSFQDMELHFLLDTRIPALRKILEVLKREEGNFDFIVRNFAVDNGSNYDTKFSDMVEIMAGGDPESPVRDCGSWIDDPVFAEYDTILLSGFTCWANTSQNLQYGSLNAYLEHYGINHNTTVAINANRNLANDSFNHLNADPSEPLITGEVNDTPDSNN